MDIFNVSPDNNPRGKNIDVQIDQRFVEQIEIALNNAKKQLGLIDLIDDLFMSDKRYHHYASEIRNALQSDVDSAAKRIGCALLQIEPT